jgi:hypothetical protein
MPKRVHSATDRDDISESTSASKRTRKPTELVCEYSINYHINSFFFFKNNLCQEFYDGFQAHKTEDGRILCENFIQLPTKRYS